MLPATSSGSTITISITDAGPGGDDYALGPNGIIAGQGGPGTSQPLLTKTGVTMSEGEFEVHGPHDDEVEHAAQHDDPFAGRIAVMTAIFATIGALFGYMGGATQNDALLFKNEASIRRTEASDQWNFYQAKSNKENLADLGATLTTGEQQTKYLKEVERYKGEKEPIMAKAQSLETLSAAAEASSEASMHVHHRWAQALTLIQIAIALAAITILTRNKGLQYISYGVAAGSMVIGALALAHI